MDPEEQQKMNDCYGMDCWSNKDFVVRVKLIREGELRLVVNYKVNGKEVVARSHVPGRTTLVIER